MSNSHVKSLYNHSYLQLLKYNNQKAIGSFYLQYPEIFGRTGMHIIFEESSKNSIMDHKRSYE